MVALDFSSDCLAIGIQVGEDGLDEALFKVEIVQDGQESDFINLVGGLLLLILALSALLRVDGLLVVLPGALPATSLPAVGSTVGLAGAISLASPLFGDDLAELQVLHDLLEEAEDGHY